MFIYVFAEQFQDCLYSHLYSPVYLNVYDTLVVDHYTLIGQTDVQDRTLFIFIGFSSNSTVTIFFITKISLHLTVTIHHFSCSVYITFF